ncbi:hypothetical protein JQ557_13755 [Bradyrhizobium sp. U87765 SZCCT0131]|uniref:hypothetical protein n=1 Tax=unclassified Bradyrhizobium TaxID=2631580 RepID=UPI001BA7AD7A|nr:MULTISPECIES: hypothetical protein [unclassified Bradyrhizobium]MBR1219064.1 hypothetical protein [Bradyrhizobium sp. U87765 SZCCT0131]MBR1261715.1 hypothetical protein [Bradyrhizobium sp. U87765 SZCCT0134]MBR1306432.1 hypothetical protein [Bradyrhizobium sp. U87765 SZCCT0110]MBR1317497.1 hypothetical protein [Bradyrhizobium sp. U87765 SZCCT0109]MBR1351199.1 hypothetical protein [Bradyrhizobium sp. U87765 SZCCT0048]
MEVQLSLPTSAPAFIDPGLVPSISDDECITCLAQAIAEHDDARLAEIASLIGRLAVVIE